jgi:CheY-like chemotaxis protein
MEEPMAGLTNTLERVVSARTEAHELHRPCHGTGVRPGASGEGALQVLGDGIEPQLIVILSDINMPGMDGLTLLGEIKERFPDLPVMMVTAYGDDQRRQRASDLGAFAFVTKPVDFDSLKARIRELERPLG